MKEDKRIVKTKRELKRTLAELLREKPFEQISVKEICDRSSTSRITFYTHYKDKCDLLNDLFKDFSDRVRESCGEMDCGDPKNGLTAFLKKLLHGEAFDRKGLIYGMGHAVYSLSDPREVVFKGYVEQLAHEKGRDKDLALYNKIEHMAPQLIAEERKIFKGVSPNVDFYSGFVYDMLGIPMELYTPLFAVARVMGWSAHRIEELLSANKIIRPAYKSLGGTHEYIRRNERE